jgi:hypothetical protein
MANTWPRSRSYEKIIATLLSARRDRRGRRSPLIDTIHLGRDAPILPKRVIKSPQIMVISLLNLAPGSLLDLGPDPDF